MDILGFTLVCMYINIVFPPINWAPNSNRAAVGQVRSGESGKRANEVQSGKLRSGRSGNWPSRANRATRAIWEASSHFLSWCQTKTLSHGQIEQSGPVVDGAIRANAPIGRVRLGSRSGQSGKCPNRASRAWLSIGPVRQMQNDIP